MSTDRASAASCRAAPVFVLGLQRSGTTWLGNLLAGHSQIAAVEAEDHFGVHESIFFSHFALEYGALSDPSNRRRFVEEFAVSDYFLLSELEASWLHDQQFERYEDCFRALMEAVAKREGDARYWLEKSPDHTLLAGQLAAGFPDAVFVGIVRSPLAVVQSRFWLGRRERPARWRRIVELARLSVSTSLVQRYLRRFCEAEPGRHLLLYEELLADPERTARRLCDVLDLSFEPGMLEERFPRNSSFRNERGRRLALDRFDRGVTRIFLACCDAVPLSRLQAAWRRKRRDRGVEWPAWCWKRRGRPSLQGGADS